MTWKEDVNVAFKEQETMMLYQIPTERNNVWSSKATKAVDVKVSKNWWQFLICETFGLSVGRMPGCGLTHRGSAAIHRKADTTHSSVAHSIKIVAAVEGWSA